MIPYTHKSRSNNISGISTFKGKDKLECGNDVNVTSISDATTNPSPNPPHFTGITISEALQNYGDELTMFEKTELHHFEFIYTIGSVRREALSEIVDGEGYYKAKIGE